MNRLEGREVYRLYKIVNGTGMSLDFSAGLKALTVTVSIAHNICRKMIPGFGSCSSCYSKWPGVNELIIFPLL